MPRYRAGHWDGYISVMSGMNAFPTGLLDYVVAGLVERGHIVEAPRSLPHVPSIPVHNTMLCGVTLRDYQMDAVMSLLANGRGVAKMATNAGKTEIMAAMLKVYDAKAVVVVHRKELMYQTADRFERRLGVPVGMIGDGVCQPAIITVAMVQTLYSRPELLDAFYDNVVLMADECHTVSSDQMLSVLNKLPGPYRFGFSGTPLKYTELADMKLIGATGPVVVDVTNAELIDDGWSANPDIELHVVASVEDRLWSADYQTAYDEAIVHNDERNRIIATRAKALSDKVVMILVTRIEHGALLQSAIPGSIFVNGSHPAELRQATLDQMRNGNVGVYIASPIFDEGVDVPGVNALILAGGGKSHIKLLQRIGRGMRKKPGDNRILIIDFIDDTNQYLLDHSDSRVEVYEKEGFNTAIV